MLVYSADMCECGHQKSSHKFGWPGHGCTVENCTCHEYFPAADSDRVIQSLADRIMREQTIDMLITLARHFTMNSKLQPVPNGTMRWKVIDIDETYPIPRPSSEYVQSKTRILEFRRFFGVWMAYDEKNDVLFYWNP